MTPEQERQVAEAAAAMTPAEKKKFEQWLAALRPWLTLRGVLIAWLALALFIAATGVLPNLEYILSTDATRQEFVGRLPFLLLLSFGGGLAAIAVGVATAFVGGHVVLYLQRRRRR